jgi:hypothetical protein
MRLLVFTAGKELRLIREQGARADFCLRQNILPSRSSRRLATTVTSGRRGGVEQTFRHRQQGEVSRKPLGGPSVSTEACFVFINNFASVVEPYDHQRVTVRSSVPTRMRNRNAGQPQPFRNPLGYRSLGDPSRNAD